MSDSFHRTLDAALAKTQEDHLPLPEFCTAMTYRGSSYGSIYDPPTPDEYCDEYALEDSEFCERHSWMEGE